MSSKNLVNIRIDDSLLRRNLNALERAATDLTPAMRKIAQTLMTETQFNFESEGRPRWVPSVAAQQRQGQTLQDSGRLGRSIDSDYDAHHAMVGTNVEYAAIHQFGGKAGRNRSVTLFARPFLPLTEEGALQREAENAVRGTLLRHLEAAAH